nr:MAG: replication associated protein [Cressdnaviricota sp.]
MRTSLRINPVAEVFYGVEAADVGAAHLSQDEPERNTKGIVPAPPPVNQRQVWIITMPKSDMSQESLFYLCQDKCKKFNFQVEKGIETGYLHWQICISLKKKLRWNQVCDIFPESAHVEGAVNTFAVENYCKKRETRVEGPWNQDSVLITDRYLLFEPFPWQKELSEILTHPPDDRTIHWYYSKTKGKLGKTLFAKHVCISNKRAIFVSGKGDDIKNAICSMKLPPQVVIFGAPKSKEKFIQYSAIEEVKDGFFFSGKYESEMKMYDCPHVIVLANFRPDVTKLMADRWHIVDIEKLGSGELVGATDATDDSDDDHSLED